MDFHLDVTPVTQPTHFQAYSDNRNPPSVERRVGIVSSSERRQQACVIPTDTVVLKLLEIARHDVANQTGSEKTNYVAPRLKQKQAAGLSPMDAARETRLALLAKKYEGVSSREDSARLALLTERIRRLQPRVTKQDIDVLTHVVDQVEQVTDSLAQMRRRLGLA